MSRRWKPSFQFHKGTIRTIQNTIHIFQLISNFNSIKVRLEQLKATGKKEGAILFQFHKGTIRTYEGMNNVLFNL